MTLSKYKRRIREEFKEPEYAHSYCDAFMNTFIAAQLVALRKQRGLTQAQLAEKAGMKQSTIARLEDCNYAAWSLTTLKRLARAYGLRLHVSFETLTSVADEMDILSVKSLRRESK